MERMNDDENSINSLKSHDRQSANSMYFRLVLQVYAFIFPVFSSYHSSTGEFSIFVFFRTKFTKKNSWRVSMPFINAFQNVGTHQTRSCPALSVSFFFTPSPFILFIYLWYFHLLSILFTNTDCVWAKCGWVCMCVCAIACLLDFISYRLIRFQVRIWSQSMLNSIENTIIWWVDDLVQTLNLSLKIFIFADLPNDDLVFFRFLHCRVNAQGSAR